MRRKLKVYGGNSFLRGIQERVVAAVHNQDEFARLISASVGYVREYCCETGNQEEIETAYKWIGEAWIQCKHCGNWSRYERKKP